MEISVKIQKIIAIDDEEGSDSMQLTAEVLDNIRISSSHQLIVTADALEDGVTLDGLSMDKGSTLRLLLFPSTKIITISVISLSHETITLKEKASETIENIKAKIWNKIGISKDLQQLFFTEELENGRTLADYNIPNESILALKIKGELRIFVKTKDNIRYVGVKSTDTVDYVKHKLQLKEGSAPGTQRLAFAGKQLEGDRSLAYYKIENDSTLELVSCGCNEMQIHVCILNGKVFSLQVESIDTIGNVKAKIQDKEMIPVNLQLLIFDGKVLVDNLTLADFGIQTKSTLGLIICRLLPEGNQDALNFLVANNLILTSEDFSSAEPN